MKSIRMIVLMGLGLSVSACAAVDTATRNAPFEQLPSVSQPIETPTVSLVTAPQVIDPSATVSSPVRVNSVTVHVPPNLKVSEANRYYPGGDIVWREDPIGNRHQQVKAIFQTSALRSAATLDGNVPVDVVIVVKRFHALTEKARYTTGGLHSITFDLALKDPTTGALLVPVREVRADLDGFGGQQAILAEARGLTQKVRITAHLAEVIRQELTTPEGYKNASLGFFQLLNKL
jgi:hypothetical protein